MRARNIISFIGLISSLFTIIPQTAFANNPARIHRQRGMSGPTDSTIEKLGAYGEFNLVTMKAGGDTSISLGGIGVGGGAHYRAKAGQAAILSLGGGIQYTSVSASSGELSVSYTLMTLRPDLAIMYQPARKWGLGGFLATDLLLLSGSASIKFGDTTTSTSISSVSQILFGLRGVYEITPRLYLGGQWGTGSGSVKVQDSSTSVSTSIMGVYLEKTF